MKLKIYGSRGSMPMFSRDNIRFGGNTPCVRLDTAGHTVILDAGSGIMRFQEELSGSGLKFDILLGHLHFDHIVGLPGFSPLWDENNNIRIYTKSRSRLPLGAQIFGVFKPPYWPVDVERMNRAELVGITGGAFSLADGITVTPFASRHHDDTTAFRIDADKSVVYLLDYEIDTDALDDLADYCRNADVIICDSTYLPEDYPAKRGWGHSSCDAGMRLAEASACKRMIFAHFSQEYSDKTLDALAERLDNNKYILAYDGMELEL